MLNLVSCIPHYEMVVLAGDMNEHIGSSNVSSDGTQGAFRYGDRNVDGSKTLEFADGLNLVICNTLLMKQESQLVTYAAGPVKRTVDYYICQVNGVNWRILCDAFFASIRLSVRLSVLLCARRSYGKRGKVRTFACEAIAPTGD